MTTTEQLEHQSSLQEQLPTMKEKMMGTASFEQFQAAVYSKVGDAYYFTTYLNRTLCSSALACWLLHNMFWLATAGGLCTSVMPECSASNSLLPALPHILSLWPIAASPATGLLL
jgi:hypothetical protein